MRALIIAVGLFLGGAIPAGAQVSIGIHVQFFPDFEPVPGYPVYYAPRLDSNLRSALSIFSISFFTVMRPGGS